MSTASERGAADELRAAHERLLRVREDLADVDREDLETVADAYERVEAVLDRWEERATDWDDFQGYVEFRNDLAETLETVPDDVAAADAFLAADGHVKTSGVSKSLTASDFAAAREALGPAREYAQRREALQEARERYRTARRAAKVRRRELRERIDDLERLLELGAADLEAPVDRLREPIERYDGAVREAFAEFRREATAREFLGFVETAAGYPLVDYERPRSELLSYVREQPAGERPIDDLLEYADYSTSKLRHYVEDPDRLKRRIATNRTSLEGLSADPLCVGWPPPAAGTLRFEATELVSVVGRFADEGTVAALRAVRALARREDYERLRTAAVAIEELTDEERRRLEEGTVEADLEAARAEYRRLGEALQEYEEL